MEITLLVLSAGMGSRYGGLKQLDHVGPSGETIMDYSIYDAINAGFNKIVFVIRHSFEKEFREKFIEKLRGKAELRLAFQELDNIPDGIEYHPEREKPWGTAHAVWTARKLITGPFAMINADDFYGREAFVTMADFLKKKQTATDNQYAMCGYKLIKTLSEYGSVSRGVCSIKDSYLETVEEHTHIRISGNGDIINRQDGFEKILDSESIVSMNFWGFTPGLFRFLDEKLRKFLHHNSMELKSEMYIPFVVDELIKEKNAVVEVLDCDAQWFGITHKEDKAKAVSNLSKLIEESVYPENLWS
ncbi:MAG: nucleotidyltransferase [Bacteroidetes bacterium]|nr:MAG: nucleotidyltransferase [Bacteroidota bacterium]